jgi:hypothetical protein
MALHFRAELIKHQKVGYAFNATPDELVAVNKQLHNARDAVVGGIAIGPVPLSQGTVTLQVIETPEPLQLSGKQDSDWDAVLKCGRDVSIRLTLRDPIDIYHDNPHRDTAHTSKFRVVLSVIILAFALIGFVWIPWPTNLLWLLFFIAAYPLVLAFTAGKELTGKELLDLYATGVKQIPVIGTFLHKLSGDK